MNGRTGAAGSTDDDANMAFRGSEITFSRATESRCLATRIPRAIKVRCSSATPFICPAMPGKSRPALAGRTHWCSRPQSRSPKHAKMASRAAPTWRRLPSSPAENPQVTAATPGQRPRVPTALVRLGKNGQLRRPRIRKSQPLRQASAQECQPRSFVLAKMANFAPPL